MFSERLTYYTKLPVGRTRVNPRAPDLLLSISEVILWCKGDEYYWGSVHYSKPSKDYEWLTMKGEAVLLAVMISLLVKQFGRRGGC